LGLHIRLVTALGHRNPVEQIEDPMTRIVAGSWGCSKCETRIGKQPINTADPMKSMQALVDPQTRGRRFIAQLFRLFFA
jgi:hypothetical protein